MNPEAKEFVPTEKKNRLADEQRRYIQSMLDLEQGNDEELRRAGEEYRFDKEKVRQAFHKPELMRLHRNFMEGNNDEELRRAGERGEEEYKKNEARTKYAFEKAMGGKKRKTKKHKKGMKKRKTKRGKKTRSKSMRKRK